MGALPYVSLYAIPAAIAALLALYAWRRRYYRSGRPFTVLMGATALWCGFRALSIADQTYGGVLFWSLLQYAGIVTIMPAWLLVAISYAGQRWRRRRSFKIAIFVPAICFFVLVLTNEQHHLWWLSVRVESRSGLTLLEVARGPFFWLHALYAYSCFIGAIGLLARTALRATAAERPQARLMLAASLVPAVGNLAYLAGAPTPWGDDPTPLLLFVGAAIAFYATMHFRVIDLAPLVEREVLAALPDGLVVLDKQAAVVEINAAATALLGVPAARAVGQPLLEVAAGSPLLGDLRAILSAEGGPRTRLAIHGADEALRAIELRVRPLLAANGALAGSMLLLRETSERVRAERASERHITELSLIGQVARAANTASETERLIRAIALSIVQAGQWDRVAVGLASPVGGSIRMVVDQGGAAGQSYEGDLVGGAAGDELSAIMRLGKSQLLDAGDGDEATMAAAIRAEGLRSLLAVPLYHQHEPLGLLLLGRRAESAGRPAQIHLAEAIGELITDAAVRARLYEEVRAADRLKSAFLATVSHELRTPLTSIMGYMEMLQRGVYGPPAERMLEPLGYMRLASGSLLRLINDILDFSRMEAGQLKVDLMPVEPRRAIASVVGQLQPQIGERGLELRLELAPELPLIVANSARLEQVLANLLSNAIKFTEAGQITVAAWPAGHELLISVQDSGIGIAPEHHATIFQEFRRVDDASRRYGGTGLGLAITRRLLELMGGTIALKSAAGRGATFTVRLPLAHLAEEEPATVMGGAAPERSVAHGQ